MPLPTELAREVPKTDAPAREHGLYWLAIAESEYEAHRFEAAAAAAHIASSHLLRAQSEHSDELISDLRGLLPETLQ